MSLVRRCTECDAGEHELHHDSCSRAEPTKPSTAEAAEIWKSMREAVLWNCYGVKDDVAKLDSYFGYHNEGTE